MDTTDLSWRDETLPDHCKLSVGGEISSPNALDRFSE